MVASLLAHLGEEAVVELTMMVAVENERARFNSAAGLKAQGFSDVCEIPLAAAAVGQQRTVGVVTTGTDAFVKHRNLLFTVAYEMLGSAADAEDVLQETWLRWAEVDRAEVRDDRAYLVRIATRLSLNRLRTLARQRETYVGPWLPEPLLTTPDVADDVELADSVSTAMLRRARDADADRAGGVRAARGLRRRVRRDRGRRGQVTRRGAPDRAPRPQPRRGPAAARAGDARGSARRSSTGSCWRWSRATCSR